MTIYDLKSRFQGLLRPVTWRLFAAGVTANQVTLSACLVSVAIGVLLIRAPRIWFSVLPVWMFLRMALNAIDGMLAREFGQKSPLGAYLNELTDVVSDAALYLPFAFVPPFDWRSVGAVIFVAALGEMTGVVAVETGASRRYDGPLGKSDRAFVFSLLAIWVASTAALPLPSRWVMWALAVAGAVTVVNRVRCGLRELRASGEPRQAAPRQEVS
jgi:CDP-diacylglycerol--glycerol-3-phosphate 3-phosphatidyltransferase